MISTQSIHVYLKHLFILHKTNTIYWSVLKNHLSHTYTTIHHKPKEHNDNTWRINLCTQQTKHIKSIKNKYAICFPADITIRIPFLSLTNIINSEFEAHCRVIKYSDIMSFVNEHIPESINFNYPRSVVIFYFLL